MDTNSGLTRRGVLAAGAAGLAAVGVQAVAGAQDAGAQRGRAGGAAAQSDEEVKNAKRRFQGEDARQWRYFGTRADGTAAANFFNIAPAQGPGEAMVSASADGQFHVFAYL